ncbi:24856_t:CDS:2 [Racocetra persica]|uniref:24856_t:CDS:1 n=1 Tax=Racocetra persica TaxID=160502 RepID=A0ACA9QVG4_9GLOM|nr:24856_t:CDS:2 [Racocetra persica]
MSLEFFRKLGIEKEISINDWSGLEINFSAPGRLEIVAIREGAAIDKNELKDVVYLPFSNPKTLAEWKPRLINLKEILKKLGLSDLRFASQPKENTIKNNDGASQGNRRKLWELGVHTKFSTLDGISSPADYAASARQKNYAALAVTDHYNVQAFPEFSQHQSPDLKIIYGCEMEMLEDKLPPYLFNHSTAILDQKINNLTYCVFDLETTGFFSEYNEIIEIGYVIYHQGEIIREKEYLIRPKKEIPAEVLAA